MQHKSIPVQKDRLREHLQALASEPRPLGSQAHQEAAKYIEATLTGLGFSVRQDRFSVQGYGGCNLVAEPPQPERSDRPVFILGAHYDSIPDSPGADDNASAVAALLEVARVLARDHEELKRGAFRLWLVAFDLEELAFLGSLHMVRTLKESNETVTGMVSLEMLGYTDDRPGSQNFPPFLQGRYPDTGNFIGLVANDNSEQLLRQFEQGMKLARGLPVESLVVPGNGELLPETRLSDHSPFWDVGYPALMVTDTSFYRNPHYHQSSDTVDTLDFDFLVNVTEGVSLAIQDLLGLMKRP